MITATLLLALALPTAAPPSDAGTDAPPRVRLLQFVGEQLAMENIECILHRRNDDPEDDEYFYPENKHCTEDDLQFRAIYRVLLPIEGETADTVEFLASGWTSYYAQSQHALLFIVVSPEGALLPAGLAVSVYRTADGDWASCDADTGSEPLEFAGDLVFGRTDGMSPHGIAKRFPSSDYVLVGQEAYCIRGRRLTTLVEDIESDIQHNYRNGLPAPPVVATQAASP